MIENLRIDGFRGLDGVELDALGQFNLIVGPGNVGKTNLIEALFLFCTNEDASLIARDLAIRGIDTQEELPKETASFIDWFFSVAQTHKAFEIEGTWAGTRRSVRVSKLAEETEIPLRSVDEAGSNEGGRDALATYQLETRTDGTTYKNTLYVTRDAVRLKKPVVANIPGRFITPQHQGQSRRLANAWTEVEEHGEREQVLALLRSLDPEIVDVRIAADELNRASMRIHHRTLGRAPLELLGAGVGKAMSIACYATVLQDGLLLIDEFDVSLHPGAQPPLIEFLLETADRHNVQVFTSTHNIETVDAFLDAYAGMEGLFKDPEGLRVFQLRRAEGRTEIRSLDSETAMRLRDEIGFDLRRTS